jgi:hypothetical protein
VFSDEVNSSLSLCCLAWRGGKKRSDKNLSKELWLRR